MQQHNRTLELHKILDMLAAHTSNAMAREMALSLEPDSDVVRVQEELNKTEEALSLAIQFGTPPFYAFQDMRGALRRAQSGGTLSLRELMDIAGVLRQIQALSDWYEHGTGLVKHLEEWFSQLTPLPYLLEKLDRSILSEEELADSASSTLAAIRRKKNQAQQKLRDTLDSMVRKKSIQDCLQDNRVTLRDGRFVLPVKAEHRGAVPGLVHDTSATGQTLFVEPMSVVEANNDIRVLERKEQEEIERIIAELCAECGTWADAISSNHIVCATLDFYFAKANLAADMKAFPPLLSDDGILELKQARHPLIPYQKAVPISFTLGKDRQALIITGPNTGGKTVALKTAGLLTLMAMCGLLIPATEGSRISVFDHVLADIGDTQSIEQNLSTFSAHMHQVISILEQADRHSLVLLDELGSGTDPVEGAALAVAIIDALKAKGAKLMVTTHYQELKLYAIQQPDVENASCEFDIETLKPTYRLIVGSPGKSNAFAISKGLGIPDAIIEEAKGLVSTENRRLEEAISKLEATRTQLEEQLELARQEQAAAKAHEQELEQELEQIRAGKAKQLEQARLQATRILETTTAQSNELLTELEQLRKEKEKASFSAGVTAAKSHSKQKLRKLYDLANPLEERAPSTYQLPRPLRAGDTVRVADTQQTGVVVGKPDQKGSIMVQIGIMKSKMPINRLQLVEQPAAPKQAKRQPAKSTGKVSTKATRKGSMELDIRGNACDEGVYEMEAFLDQAVLSNISTVTIIHGKGTGLLRIAVRQRLKQLSCVKSFRPCVYGEGEDGVTIVTLK